MTPIHPSIHFFHGPHGKVFPWVLSFPFTLLSGEGFLEIAVHHSSIFQDKMDDNSIEDQHKLWKAIGILGNCDDQKHELQNLKDSIEYIQNPNNIARRRIPPAAVSISPMAQPPVAPGQYPITHYRGRAAAPPPAQVAQDFDYQSAAAHHPRTDFHPWRAFITRSLSDNASSADGIGGDRPSPAGAG